MSQEKTLFQHQINKILPIQFVKNFTEEIWDLLSFSLGKNYST